MIFTPIKIISTLPTPLSPNTVYFIRAGVGFDLYCSDSTGSIAHKINSPTSSEILSSLLTVDGAGSGLDADLLDGQQGSFYRSATNLNAGTLPTARLPAFTGDATSSAGSNSLTLTNSGITAGTYRSITVDAKGRATAGSNPTTFSGYGINDSFFLGTTAVNITRASGSQTINGLSISGNADTATTLANSRTINGTSFNGSTNITTTNWGTARNLTIGNSSKSVNGGSNVSWTLSEIGAVDKESNEVIGGNKNFNKERDYLINGESISSLYSSMNRAIILLHQYWESGFLDVNYCTGTFYFFRGSSVATNRQHSITVNSSSAYNSNLHSVSSTGEDITPRLYTCYYNSIKYLTLEIPYSPSIFQCFKFVGCQKSTAPLDPFLIPYYNENTSTILNEEVYNSLTEVTNYRENYYRGRSTFDSLRLFSSNFTNHHTISSLATANRTLNLPDRNINLDTDYPRITTVPSTPTSAGIVGQIAYDNSFIYICTATNTWRRVAISSW